MLSETVSQQLHAGETPMLAVADRLFMVGAGETQNLAISRQSQEGETSLLGMSWE